MCNFLIRSLLTPSSRSSNLTLAVRSCSFRSQTRQIGPDWPRAIPLSYLPPLAILSRFSRQYVGSLLRHRIPASQRSQVKVKATAPPSLLPLATTHIKHLSGFLLRLSSTKLGPATKAYSLPSCSGTLLASNPHCVIASRPEFGRSSVTITTARPVPISEIGVCLIRPLENPVSLAFSVSVVMA